MGIIFSRVRKRKSPVETLEKLEHDIKEIEENRTYAQMRYRKITKLFLVYSLGLYVLFGVFLYFHFTSTLKGKLLYLVPLALSPLLLYLVKQIIAWYYVRLINKNQIRLNEMKKEKKRILDEVMDKETYKVAKEILEKFSEAPKPNIHRQLANIKPADEGLRNRIATLPNVPKTEPPRGMVRSFVGSQTPRPISQGPVINRPMQGSPMIGLPAPILPLQKSYVDKVVEYLIGDGPNNRYALICSRCSAHNGMALKEEFEYISFKCCYCFFFNPARKVRPEAPRLEGLPKAHHESDSDSDSKTSGDNSEAETKALVGVSQDLGESSTGSKEIKETSFQDEDFKPSADTEIDEAAEEKEILSDNYTDENINTEKKQRRESKQEENSNPPENDENCDTSLVNS